MARGFSEFKYMTFDVVGTLIDFEGGITTCLAGIADEAGVSIDGEAALTLYRQARYMPDAGLFPKGDAPARSEPALPFTGVQQKILAALAHDAGPGVSADEVCERSGLPASVVMAELTLLQIRGAILRASASRFALRKGT